MSTIQPTRHPPEVIEAARITADSRNYSVDEWCRAGALMRARTQIADPIYTAARVLADALACAEADRDAFVDVVKEGKFPYTTEAAVVVCSHVFGSYRRVTTNLQDCVQKYRLGFAGDPVDEILCREYAAERQRREKAEREAEIQKTARKDMDRVATIWAERAENAERELSETRKALHDMSNIAEHMADLLSIAKCSDDENSNNHQPIKQ